MKILAISGSLRSGSSNTAALRASRGRRRVRRLLALALVVIAAWFALTTGRP